MKNISSFAITILICILSVGNSFGGIEITDSLCADSSVVSADTLKSKWKTEYDLGNGTKVIYEKPGLLDFGLKVPRDMWGFCKYSVKGKSWPYLAIIAFTSGVLIDNDQNITDETQRFCDDIHLARSSSYKDVFAPKLNGQKVSIISIPQNINTVFYTLGQGYPALLLGGGLLYYGARHHDMRAVSTASQLTEAFIAMGIATQVVKRITGRETPIRSTQDGGKWQPFPSFNDYQKNTPVYDAFPSGHLATVICAVTILAENYPEKKWIKPIGYSLASMVAFAMVNNGVHWAGDYPLAIGIGYGFGKVVSARCKKVVHTRY